MNIRTWRDQPKPGETDARWCASLAIDGHIQHITHGHDSEDAARQACADRAALGREYLEKIGYDPFEDDPTISTETVRQTLAEYDQIAAEPA